MKTDDRNIPGEAAAGCGWNNRLPAWIRSDPAYKDLRQGPLHTLQVIADRCDGPLRDDNAEIIGSATLLVCFGGKRLIKECGCWPSTFWSHMRTLQALGYVVPLTNGGAATYLTSWVVDRLAGRDQRDEILRSVAPVGEAPALLKSVERVLASIP